MLESVLAPRVLMLSDVYFPRVNGVSTSIQTFRRELEAMGCTTWLAAPAYPTPGDHDDMRLRRVPSRPLPIDPEDRLMRPRALEAACRELEGRIDLIHVHTPFVAHRAGVRLGRAWGVPVIETCHTHFEQYFRHYLPLVPEAWLAAAARRISRRLFGAVAGLILPSEPMAAVLRSYGVTHHMDVVPTGIDVEQFRGGDGARFRRRFGIDPDRPIVLHVGRIAHEKNVGFLIETFMRVLEQRPDALLVVAGEGPARASLERRVRELGLDADVGFVGYLRRDAALVDCYASAAVFVFASNTETQGIVLLEALAAGTPVVSTAVLGTKAVLEHARGAIVVEEDPAAFAAATVRVLTNARLRNALSREARAHVTAHWSATVMAERMLEAYRRALNRSWPTANLRPTAEGRLG